MDLDPNAKPKSRRGFAAMNPERRREIARKGGASVPGEKRSFAKDRDLAAAAGRKGGESSRGGGRTPGTTTPGGNPGGARQG
jgi:general stress protein YciG